jgi:hypothetical protein
MRLPTRTTVHIDRFDDSTVRQDVETYDRRRDEHQPITSPRSPERFAAVPDVYGWSEDKARQYAVPEREDFGRFVRAQGFCLK